MASTRPFEMDLVTFYKSPMFASQVSYLLLLAPGKQVWDKADLKCFYILHSFLLVTISDIYYTIKSCLNYLEDGVGHFHILILN